MLPLTPQMCAATYECLRQFPPFAGWKLLPADEVEFRCSARLDVHGEFQEWDPHIITVSTALVGHFDTLAEIVGHEMIHLAQTVAGTANKSQHNADFRRRARLACRLMGWDPKAF